MAELDQPMDEPKPVSDLPTSQEENIREIQRAVERLTIAMARIDTRTDKIEQNLNSLTSMTAQSPNGITLINLVEQIFRKVQGTGIRQGQPPSLLTLIAPPSINVALSFLGRSKAVLRPGAGEDGDSQQPT